MAERRPLEVIFVESFPYTPEGRVEAQRLQDRYAMGIRGHRLQKKRSAEILRREKPRAYWVVVNIWER